MKRQTLRNLIAITSLSIALSTTACSGGNSDAGKACNMPVRPEDVLRLRVVEDVEGEVEVLGVGVAGGVGEPEADVRLPGRGRGRLGGTGAHLLFLGQGVQVVDLTSRVGVDQDDSQLA